MYNKYILHINDIPENINLIGDIAVDTEAMGLNIKRDRLCLVQICDEERNIHLIQFPHNQKFHNKANYSAPILRSYLEDPNRQKIFHYARFDVAILQHYLNIPKIPNIFCTKIASKFCRTYTDHHGLKSLVHDLLGIELKKEQQTTYWGTDKLSEAQCQYAKNDVFYLHQLREKLLEIMIRTERQNLIYKYFDFLHTIIEADNLGFVSDMFSHAT